MAQSGKKTTTRSSSSSSRSTSRSGSAGKPRSNTTRSSSSSSRAPAKQTKAAASKSRPKDDVVEVGFGDYWHEFTKTKVFLPIMVILVTAVLVGLDLLISWNSYERFFMFLGIELIIAASAWLIIMIYSIGSSRKSSGNKEEV